MPLILQGRLRHPRLAPELGEAGWGFKTGIVLHLRAVSLNLNPKWSKILLVEDGPSRWFGFKVGFRGRLAVRSCCYFGNCSDDGATGFWVKV